MVTARRCGMLFRRLAHCRSGAAAALLAISLPALAGVAALAVDLSSLYLSERRLQGIADAAAAASITGDAAQGRAAALAVIARSGEQSIVLEAYQPGQYLRDPAIAHEARFQAGAEAVNAARVQLRQHVPLFFGHLLTGRASSGVTASATATKSDLVAFEIGTKLLSVSDNLPGRLLSALAGANLGLTGQDVSLLASTRIDVMRFAQALRARNAGGKGTLENSLNEATALSDIIGAMGDSVDADAALVLGRIAALAMGNDVAVGDMIDLGPWGRSDTIDARIGAEVDVYTLLRSLLEAGHGPAYSVALDVAIPGVSKATLRVAGGNGWERSPWMTFDQAGDVTIRTAMTRIYLDLDVAPSLLGSLLALRLPLFIEVASAEARISSIVCNPNAAGRGVTIEARPSIGTVALADFDAARMADVSRAVPLRNASLVRLPLISIDGFAKVALGGNAIQRIHFNPAEIAAGARKEVGTRDLTAGLTGSLLKNLSLDINLLGLNLGLGLSKTQLTQTIGQALVALSPAIDALLNQVTGLLGIKLGVAEVSVNALRCGQPMIVA